ncbi:hypothetical protein BDY21DRAFT_282380 [Lineolata rhizophorae]|uniref:N-acetyltransferase domain-containing protein n=1 Tax=Lineolata rhizophorae TaxID=578093 RepID=A0A6A6P6R3_9PEZI|nr:hypothetical protein BDY21DRAFT_282380 [Lineolata rhizophorae]
MPAMLEDPKAARISSPPGLEPGRDLMPRVMTLRDKFSIATVVPFYSLEQVPLSLLSYLCDQLNVEIERGDTYPMTEPFTLEAFGPYWFSNFGAIMFRGEAGNAEKIKEDDVGGYDWTKNCLGSFYIKPNYPGRSSHVCNGGFLVTDASRNQGVGKAMGKIYIEWAHSLGYTYSVFNLVYETNVVSCRIWDSLGFKKIGRVPGAGSLKSQEGKLVDAIIYGRDLTQDLPINDDGNIERFMMIKHYLSTNEYPDGIDRKTKAYLRTCGSSGYGIDESGRLVHKGKQVIMSLQEQRKIAKEAHGDGHLGVNKITKQLAAEYFWPGIKYTCLNVIHNCESCQVAMKEGLRGGYSKGSTANNENSSSYAGNKSSPNPCADETNIKLQPVSRATQTDFAPTSQHQQQLAASDAQDLVQPSRGAQSLKASPKAENLGQSAGRKNGTDGS